MKDVLDGKKIAVIGDSLIYGGSLGKEITWVNKLTKYGMIPYNYGIGGNIDGTLEVCGAKFTFTQAFHSAKHGSPVGFVIEMPGGHTVYHAGDTGLFGDMTLIAERFQLDVAMLPIGGVFTMDGPLAAKAAAMLKARAAMPIHYATFPILAQDASAFTEALAQKAPDCKALVLEPCQSVDFA